MMQALLLLGAVGASTVLLYMLFVSLHNYLAFPRLEPVDQAVLAELPPVSVLIPARNEADRIAASIKALLCSDYPCFELIVLDDDSSDGTADVACLAGRGDGRLRIVRGAPLPNGWLGKNWACHQLAGYASHELLLFTDADVLWQRAALAAVVSHRQSVQADLLTIWPAQQTGSFGERLLVPMIAFTLLAYLPVSWAHDPEKPLAAAANGQCLLFRASAYAAIGGHAAVCTNVIEDVSLAGRIKRNGLSLRMADARGFVCCRMYDGLRGVLDGYTKAILAAHFNSPGLLLASSTLHLLVFVAPWLWLLFGFQWALPYWPVWPAFVLSMGLSIRFLTAATAGLCRSDTLLLPLSVLVLTAIAFRALWANFRYGGPTWRGRRIPTHPDPSHGASN
jgi:chlorobactene glucosyltransferase